MSTRRKVLTACAIVVATAGGLAGSARGDDGNRYYLSLGDSMAQGYQPIGGPRAPPRFPGHNPGDADPRRKLVRGPAARLGGGETTTTMLAGAPWCGFEAGSQLSDATQFLRAHRGEVAFVTIDIGGNDLVQPDGGGVAAIQANLPAILHELRDAAGPAVPIV